MSRSSGTGEVDQDDKKVGLYNPSPRDPLPEGEEGKFIVEKSFEMWYSEGVPSASFFVHEP
jgi:hypothetical protein